ncbi:hypothetical protein GGS23DRAFT_454939 [Durotheca rogersii]|uniref:uncharacterized protein n=1 Tax=Durotheca rogersii TaxID=419775 RepID=UPI00221EDCC4|nr:uncharacterized protein GGS23DRAFT_454939 [Durotheca rogersii]KAI5864596.1 hypothetical protein GGS23DRAFT_454939 [Durotheca rogersii]
MYLPLSLALGCPCTYISGGPGTLTCPTGPPLPPVTGPLSYQVGSLGTNRTYLWYPRYLPDLCCLPASSTYLLPPFLLKQNPPFPTPPLLFLSPLAALPRTPTGRRKNKPPTYIRTYMLQGTRGGKGGEAHTHAHCFHPFFPHHPTTRYHTHPSTHPVLHPQGHLVATVAQEPSGEAERKRERGEREREREQGWKRGTGRVVVVSRQTED